MALRDGVAAGAVAGVGTWECFAVAGVRTVARAAELEACAGARPGVALTGVRAITGAGFAAGAGARVAAPAFEEGRRVAGEAAAVRDGTAPLVVAEAEAPFAVAFATAGVGAGAAAGAPPAAAGSTGAAGGAPAPASEDGGTALEAVGVAGVPKPDGVQAHASAAPTTPTLSTDNTVRQKTRTRCCTGIPLGSSS